MIYEHFIAFLYRIRHFQLEISNINGNVHSSKILFFLNLQIAHHFIFTFKLSHMPLFMQQNPIEPLYHIITLLWRVSYSIISSIQLETHTCYVLSGTQNPKMWCNKLTHSL